MPQRAELYLRYALADGEVSRSLILFGTSVNEEGKVFVPSVIWCADGDLENNPSEKKGYVLEMLEMGEPSINKGPILSLVNRRLGGVVRARFESLAPKILSYAIRRLVPKYLYTALEFQANLSFISASSGTWFYATSLEMHLYLATVVEPVGPDLIGFLNYRWLDDFGDPDLAGYFLVNLAATQPQSADPDLAQEIGEFWQEEVANFFALLPKPAR
jgi:hypothetical protein